VADRTRPDYAPIQRVSPTAESVPVGGVSVGIAGRNRVPGVSCDDADRWIIDIDGGICGRADPRPKWTRRPSPKRTLARDNPRLNDAEFVGGSGRLLREKSAMLSPRGQLQAQLPTYRPFDRCREGRTAKLRVTDFEYGLSYVGQTSIITAVRSSGEPSVARPRTCIKSGDEGKVSSQSTCCRITERVDVR